MLTLTGIVMVYSASFVVGLADFGDSRYFVTRQALWATLGALLLTIAVKTDYRRYATFAIPLMGLTIAALLAVLVIGTEVNGAQRWLGFGELGGQPAEFAKLTVIIYLAAWLTSKGDSLRSFEHGLLPFVLILATIGVLLMMQPDLGTTFIILLVTATMFWVAGATFLQMLALSTAGSLTVIVLALIEGYRLDRLSAFFHAEDDPLGSGFQTLQSLIALGHGGVTGLGLGASRGKFFYVPERQTDGIFAILGEELGLVATAAVLLLFVTLMLRGYQIASRSRDQFGFLVATGITTWIVAQALVNIGGITRLIPLTGVPLPFLSYGGSALAATMLAVGILINISRNGTDRGGYHDREGGGRRIVRRGRRT